MQATAIVERSVLENKTYQNNRELPRCCTSLLLVQIYIHSFEITVSVVSRTMEDRDKGTMHSTEQTPTKYAGNTKHMERMHKNIMFGLEDEHKVEGAEMPSGIPSEKLPCPKG